MFFWEITQCNKRFRSFIIDTDRAHDFIILVLFYALEHKNEPLKQGLVRMCAFLLQTLSVESHFGISLNKKFEGQESLPQSIRINGFHGSYADFAIQSIYTLITTSRGKLSAIYPALLAVINNIAPHLENLSATTCSRLMQLFSSVSSPAFLLASETNHDLLHSLLDSLNSIIENKYQKNRELIVAVFRNKRRIEALRSFTLDSGREEIERRKQRRKDSGGQIDPFDSSSVRSSVDSAHHPPATQARAQGVQETVDDTAFAVGDDESDEDLQATPPKSTPSENPSRSSSVAPPEDAVPIQVRGMSEKARGKMPAGTGSFSRTNSTTSLGVDSASSQSPNASFEPTSQWIDSWLPELPLHTLLSLLQQVSALLAGEATSNDSAAPDVLRHMSDIVLVGVEPSTVRVHSFEWSQLALGWYESLLWSNIFTSEMQIAKGTMGVWNGTAIRLFRVQETAREGPSLTSPRGAVDAVGSNIVSRIGQINIRGATSSNNAHAGNSHPGSNSSTNGP